MTLNISALKKKLTYRGYAAGGAEAKFICPFCTGRGLGPDKRGHLYINLRSGSFFCHRCNIKGRKEFLEQYLGISLGFDIPEPRSDLSINIGSTDSFTKELLQELIDKVIPLSDIGLRYLVDRGLSEEQIKGYEFVEISTISNRICIPLIFNNELVAFQCRSYIHEEPKYLFQPKYIKIKEMLFQYDIARFYNTIYLVEGVFDAVSVGFNSMAMYGHYLSKTQLELLIKSNVSNIVILLDRDTEEDSQKIANKLSTYFNTVGYLTWKNIPEEFKDIDEIHRIYGKEGVDLILTTQINYV